MKSLIPDVIVKDALAVLRERMMDTSAPQNDRLAAATTILSFYQRIAPDEEAAPESVKDPEPEKKAPAKKVTK